MKFLYIALILHRLGITHAVQLGTYNVAPDQISVSGISSGAAMATQYHFAHSTELIGAGIFAGLPNLCGSGGLLAAESCMNFPTAINVNLLIAEVTTLANSGSIDPTTGIHGDRVYIYHGQADTTVYPAAGPAVERMYAHYNANISTEFTINGAHGQPTDDFGELCNKPSEAYHYINNCNYTGAFEMLNHLYGGNLARPSANTAPFGELLEFDQSEFFYISPPSVSSMATTGYVYIPSSCKDRSTPCRLHVVFHGCKQNRGNAGDVFVRRTGYLEAAELNNIIVLFPQTIATPLNPNACWDWWGYLNIYFPTKIGNQILATKRMVDRIVSG